MNALLRYKWLISRDLAARDQGREGKIRGVNWSTYVDLDEMVGLKIKLCVCMAN
jgi:hypothetical protein